MWWYAFGGFLIAMVFLFIGLAVGRGGERDAWVLRAYDGRHPWDMTAHFCDGVFYYVIEETAFVREFRLRPAEEKPCSLPES